MRPIVVGALVVGAVGVWAGITSPRTSPEAINDRVAVALFGANLLLWSWALWRAKPGTGDAIVLPTVILGFAVTLIGMLPRLFWPGRTGVHAVGLALSAAVLIALVVRLRNRSRGRDSARSA